MDRPESASQGSLSFPGDPPESKGPATEQKLPETAQRAGPGLWAALATLSARLDEWRESLAAYAAQADFREGAMASAVGRVWASALAALGEDKRGPRLAADRDSLPALLAECDRCGRSMQELSEAAAALFSPGVRAAAEHSMSRSFSDSLALLRRAAATAEKAVNAAEGAALAAADAAGVEAAADGTAALTEAFGAARGRGRLATELYVCALARLGEDRLLEAARDRALDAPADTREAIAEDGAALAEYHPLQAMGSAPPAFESAPRKGAESLDLVLPQARLAVSYDMAPLLDRKSAAQFGPLAPALAGLSKPLVERLRSIRVSALERVGARRSDSGPPGEAPEDTMKLKAGLRAEPLSPEPARQARPGSVCLGPGEGLWVSTDAGATRRRLWAPRLSTPPGARDREGARPAAWCPLAGATPRTGEYAAVMAEIILGAVGTERAAGWSLDLRELYEASARQAPQAPASSDALLGALLAAFDQDYAAAPPADEAAFRALVAPPLFDPSGYISRATARLGEEALAAELGRASGTSGLLPALSGEGRVTRALQALDAAREIWRRMRSTFRAPAPAPAAAMRAAHRMAFKRSAEAALQIGPIALATPSLKLYAAVAVR